MINRSGLLIALMRAEPSAPKSCRTRATNRIIAAATIIVAAAGPATAAAPAAGDTYVYRVSNVYNKDVSGQLSYRIEKVEANRVVIAVTLDNPAFGHAHTEIFTPEGNWMRYPVTNHDRPVEYEFAPVFPAYVFPLDPGKTWSLRVVATNPATGQRNSVRVDGDVLGAERITVPAGSYDTIKVRRRIYAGDWASFRHETNITEIDWYALALGRPVRSETKSEYMEPSRCGDIGPCQPMRGDWHVFELAETMMTKP